jgi:UDP-glucuronate 4-epimerase
MHVLVTGAAGFVGSHLAERLRARGDTVVGFDNFDAFYPRAVKERNLARLRQDPGFRLIEGDLRSPADLARALAEAGAVEAVVHLAALAGVRPSLLDPARFYEVNVMGTLHLLEACHARRLRRVVFASSSSVYGLDSAVPFRESDPCATPLSPYAATKRACELVAFNAHHLHDLSITALRLFTVYGPRQRPDLAIHKFTRLIATGQPLELFGDGSTSRDYTWIDDIVDGILAAVDQQGHDREPTFRIYNLGGSQTTSLRELVDAISAALGRQPVIDWKPEQPGDMKRTLADVSLASRELGYAPRVPISEGIPRFVAWWRAENAT